MRKNDSKEAKAGRYEAGKQVKLFDPVPVGDAFVEPPFISHILPFDFDKDGLLDIIICDCRSNSVNWIRQHPSGVYNEIVMAGDMLSPAHAEVSDFDGDGDYDILVAVMGMLFPNNDKIGSVIILENDGNNNFLKRTIVEKVARVTDVRAGDLDGDGDNDLAVAQFGYDDGETRWIENLGGWNFENHMLQSLSGPINVIIMDLDRDNDNDIISLVSQEWEEIYCWLNDGKGNFHPRLLFGSDNKDFGSSNIFIADPDQDGDNDILYTNGDAFDYIPPQGKPWHGVEWLENKGDLNFEFHAICNFIGAYNARPCDIDFDGDIDLFAVSCFNSWEDPDAQSLIWMENIGNMQFITHGLASNPTHLLTLETGDFNNDGLMDMVSGGMHVYPPYDRMGRITLWMNNGEFSKMNN
ncbi:MAG: VCBS repeat-containing protein [Bacteroidota bacterium]